MATWYPPLVSELCARIEQGERLWDQLNDALVDAGFEATAYFHCRPASFCRMGNNCFVFAISRQQHVCQFGKKLDAAGLEANCQETVEWKFLQERSKS